MKKLDILLLGKYVKKKAHRSSIYNFLKKSHNITFVDEFQKIKFKSDWFSLWASLVIKK